MTKVSCAAGTGSANNDAADVVFFTGMRGGRGVGGPSLTRGERGGTRTGHGGEEMTLGLCAYI